MNPLIEYISNNDNWEADLASEPYNLFIRTNDEYPNLRLFTYNQIKSDMTDPVVQKARGIIIDIDTMKVVCHPFDKFFNYNDERAHAIDWSTAAIQEKVDGSIMKLYWYDGDWQVATNGTIDAMNTDLPCPAPGGTATFGDLFYEAMLKYPELSLNDLDTQYTYIFEITSPYNRVVVPHTEIGLTLIGVRNSDTGEETMVDIGVPRPKSYKFSSFDEMLAASQALPFDDEGYVVVDGNWSRVKVKSPAYLHVHHLADNGNVSRNRIFELVRTGESVEFLNYYPEYNEIFDEVRLQWMDHQHKVQEIKLAAAELKSKSETRKDFALAVQKLPKVVHPYYFAVMDGSEEKLDNLMDRLTFEKLFPIDMEVA